MYLFMYWYNCVTTKLSNPGLGSLTVEVPISHTQTLRRQNASEWVSTLPTQHTSNTNRRTSTLSARFEPATAVINLPQNYALERTATGIGANKHKGKTIPLQVGQPSGFEQIEAPRFQDNRHLKLVRLSAPGTGRLYLPGNIPGTHFC
jgi:hypothetical protein